MNVVREINKINQAELDFGASGASWHDEYKDSAYIFVGGLHFDLTEGDVVTIFSQFGEVMDVNMPRDKDTGKRRGFAFLMYEDQRSTVLAVDNLNGAQVLEKTLRVDHVKNYKQGKVKNEDGELVEPDEQSFNAKPELIMDDDDAASESSASTGASIDPEDPMRDFLIAQRREAKALQKTKSKSKKSKSKGKHKDETPEERRVRKARKAEKKALKSAASAKKAQSQGVRGVQDLLKSLGGAEGGRQRSLSPGPRRSRSPGSRRDYSPAPYRGRESYGDDRDSRRNHSRERVREWDRRRD
ncbi:hypothetical protein C8F01DRAFT_1160722 [Mycena amicta]|nr:hypothetical protein C8F01DRAFT_1160722 [Mycena amicta]